AALGARYRVLRTASSFNNEIGVPLTFLGIEPSHEVAVIEMGFYVPGEIADLCRLVRPRIGIITRIPDVPVHYSRTPSVDAIAAGKAELVEALPADGVALLNADDARVRALASRSKARVVLFGESGDADLRASEVSARGIEGLHFVAHDGAQRVEVVEMARTTENDAKQARLGNKLEVASNAKAAPPVTTSLAPGKNVPIKRSQSKPLEQPAAANVPPYKMA